MQKKLTLNQAWTLCLRQWKWIIEQLDKGTSKCIATLKEQWLAKNGYGREDINGDCFFCEYAARQEMISCRRGCPGCIVNSRFNCENSSYQYCYKPRKFYKKLLELNEKRKGA